MNATADKVPANEVRDQLLGKGITMKGFLALALVAALGGAHNRLRQSAGHDREQDANDDNIEQGWQENQRDDGHDRHQDTSHPGYAGRFRQ